MSINTIPNNSEIMNGIADAVEDILHTSIGNITSGFTGDLGNGTFTDTSGLVYNCNVVNTSHIQDGRIIVSGFLQAQNSNYASTIQLVGQLSNLTLFTLTIKGTVLQNNVFPINYIVPVGTYFGNYENFKLTFSTTGGSAGQSYRVTNLYCQADLFN